MIILRSFVNDSAWRYLKNSVQNFWSAKANSCHWGFSSSENSELLVVLKFQMIRSRSSDDLLDQTTRRNKNRQLDGVKCAVSRLIRSGRKCSNFKLLKVTGWCQKASDTFRYPFRRCIWTSDLKVSEAKSVLRWLQANWKLAKRDWKWDQKVFTKFFLVNAIKGDRKQWMLINCWTD